jgi:inner membrane protein
MEVKMSNGLEHQIAAAAVVGSVCMWTETDPQKRISKSLSGAVLAAGCTKLPDVLEPAVHPNHRQFFHGVAFAGLLGTAVYKLYRWEPEHSSEKLLRFSLLVGTSAYLIHLLLDAGTPKSLPLIGKI